MTDQSGRKVWQAEIEPFGAAAVDGDADMDSIALAVGVFLVLSIAASLWIAKVGDKALPGAVTIYP